MDLRAKRRLLKLALGVGVTAPAFMAAVSCLPDISTAKVSPFDASGDLGPPPVTGSFCGDGLIDYDAGEHCDQGDGAPGCVSCQVTCDGGLVDPVTDHCYFPLPATPAFASAQAACENAGAHLVTFASEDEYAKVATWKAGDRPKEFWVGLQFEAPNDFKAVVAEPGWSGTCEGCFAHVDAGATNIPRQSRDAGGVKQTSCVLSTDVATPWNTIPCDLGPIPLGVVCEREPPGTTAHTCGTVPGKCLATRGPSPGRYIYFSLPATAQEAIDACKGIGATLVVFETREEREQVSRALSSFLGTSPTPQFWIGLSRVNNGVNAVWTWANGTPATQLPSEWADDQPLGGTFAWISLPGSLFDTQLAHVDDGGAKIPYVCELPK